MTNSKITKTEKEGEYRIITVEEYGAKTADECAPFGFDGNPIDGLDAIYTETDTSSESVIIGYIQTQRIAGRGESRMYSLRPSGFLSTYVCCRSDQTIELGGNDENLVKFSELKTCLQKIQNDINTELTKIQAAIVGVGGVYVPEPIVIDSEVLKTELIKIKKTSV